MCLPESYASSWLLLFLPKKDFYQTDFHNLFIILVICQALKTWIAMDARHTIIPLKRKKIRNTSWRNYWAWRRLFIEEGFAYNREDYFWMIVIGLWSAWSTTNKKWTTAFRFRFHLLHWKWMLMNTYWRENASPRKNVSKLWRIVVSVL